MQEIKATQDSKELKTKGIVQDNMAWCFNHLEEFLGIGRRFMHEQSLTLKLTPGQRICDVGCGTGNFLVELYTTAKKSMDPAAVEFVGIEPAPKLLAKAEEFAKSRAAAIDFRIGVIENIDCPNDYFDLITCTFMLHHLPLDSKKLGLAEVHRVLKPGGRVMIIDIGKPRTFYEKICAATNSWVEHFDSNIHGEIPMLLNELEYDRVNIFDHRTSLFLGSIDFVEAFK